MKLVQITFLLIQLIKKAVGDTEGAMRLVSDSSKTYEGIVEIYHNNTWGSIDQRDITDTTASVICRLLGLGEKGFEIDYYYTKNRTRRLFSYVYCNGDENSILDCRFSLRTAYNTTEGAGVICKEILHRVKAWITGDESNTCLLEIIGRLKPEISSNKIYVLEYDPTKLRLRGGFEDSEGHLQFLFDGDWAGLCEDTINYETYHLACKQMGYSIVESYRHEAPVNPGNADILPFQYHCSQSDTSLHSCQTKIYSYSNCTKHGRIVIKCKTFLVTKSRIIDGTNDSNGRVELFDGSWKTVCSAGFTSTFADVVCRDNGWKTALSFNENGDSGTTGEIIPYYIGCHRFETDIRQCTTINRNYSCSHANDVSINCSKFEITDVRLANGTTSHEGRLELRVDGDWMTVCDKTFLTGHALDTVCKSIGYRGVVEILPHAHFGQGSGGLATHYFSCPTDAESLSDCNVRYSGYGGCTTHSDDLSVVCSNLAIQDIHLVGGSFSNEGRVELLIDDEWRTVCGSYWYKNDLDALCRTLGFVKSDIFYHIAHFGEGNGKILTADFVCSGKEPNLQNCSVRNDGNICKHSADLSIKCRACGSLDIQSNGLINISGTSHGDVATFDCKPGFSLIGSPLRVCLSNNTWNGTEAKCEIKVPESKIPRSVPQEGNIIKEGLLYGGITVALLLGVLIGVFVTVLVIRKRRYQETYSSTHTNIAYEYQDSEEHVCNDNNESI